ncbi:MAG: AI-2E family transporter [Eubacterium sp.]|nr:AI-2E family transporter [Eubacterium sp.]
MNGKQKEKTAVRYVALGLTIFISGAALIILYMSMSKYHSFVTLFNKGLMIISPFIYGIVLAYLLEPLYELIRKPLHKVLDSKLKEKYHPRMVSVISGGVAVAITMLAFILFLIGFGFLVIPQIIDSLSSLVVAIPQRVQEVIDFIQKQNADSEGMLMKSLIDWLQNSTENITSWISGTVLPKLGSYMSQIYQGLWSTVKTVMNIAIGLITSVYLMTEREHFKASIVKIVRALWPKEKADEVIDFLRFSNKAFGGFISGKVIDSIIVGIICFAVLSILKIPYAVLVSVIVGITNIIPFFGPFIGAIPGAFIIGAADPVKMLIFLVVIFALQQFDGYVLGPKILGDSTGLSSFWVMFAIIIGGGMFGFAGMVFAVPTFAVIMYLFNKHINKKLTARGLPTEVEAYESGNVGKTMLDDLGDKAGAAVESLDDATDTMTEIASDAAEVVGKTASDAVETVGNAASDAAEVIKR